MARAPLALVVAAVLALPAAALGQAVGGAVPPYQEPAKVPPPERSDRMMEREAKAPGALDAQPATVDAFRAAYGKRGKPRLALFWNREFRDTLEDWYAPFRVVERNDLGGAVGGAVSLNGNVSLQRTTEPQLRNPAAERPQLRERYDWEFQDGFLAPFLEAGAQMIDRATVVRLTAADQGGADPAAVETRALQGKADFIVLALATPSGQSRTGYELMARVIDIKTGAIVANVNSRRLKEWNPEKRFEATDHGFVDTDPDDELVGPEGDPKVRADEHGIKVRRPPPKLHKVAQNLAYNVMSALTGQWQQ
jgi:hypothetical protein